VVYVLIVFVRHGKAEPLSEKIKDEDRRLTDKGIDDIKALSSILEIKPKRIYTSPLKRAVQTAELLREHLGGDITKTDALAPEKASVETIKSLELSDGDILVGHSPSIERIVSEIIGGGNIKIKAGGAAGVEVESLDPGRGTLIFLIQPFLYEMLFKG